MQLIHRISEMREWIKTERYKGNKIGLVPTMGYLHEGHLSLVEKARKQNQAVVMSIFVNPLQFGPQEDYQSYPRDLQKDCDSAEKAGVDVVFNPSVEEMYLRYPPYTTVCIEEITKYLCGKSRPGHFQGVATVVSKLFNIVQPDRAYFGQKDYQQLIVIKTLVEDLNIPVAIEGVPIKREKDGLAVSSRNVYLSGEEREQAVCLYEALMLCQDLYMRGERGREKLIQAMKERILQESKATIDYVEVCDTRTLVPVSKINTPAVAALAVKIGNTRLIDNVILGGDKNAEEDA